MRAITIRQPWSWAIVYGGKRVENRSRNIAGTYRGPVGIHAGLADDVDGYDDDLIRDAFGQYDDGWLLAEQVGQTGAFIGVADLVDVHKDWADEREYGPVTCCASPWAQPRMWHLVLGRVRPLPTPIPARGQLGLWTPPINVLEQLQEVA